MSLYDLVFSQAEQETCSARSQVKEEDDFYSSHVEATNDDPFRLEALKAAKVKKQELELEEKLEHQKQEPRNNGRKTRRQRVYSRPTMYRTQEEWASLRAAYQRTNSLRRRAKRSRWKYFHEDDDADAGDVIFQKVAQEQGVLSHDDDDDVDVGEKNVKDDDNGEEEEYTENKEDDKETDMEASSNGKRSKRSTKAAPTHRKHYANLQALYARLVHPLRLFGQSVKGMSNPCLKRIMLVNLNKPDVNYYWPMGVPEPIGTKQKNPVNRHITQLGFVAARLLLNACGSNATCSDENDTHAECDPTALTMKAIEHLYHTPRRGNNPFSAAFKFAMSIIPLSASDPVMVPPKHDSHRRKKKDIDDEAYKHAQCEQSAHDILQNQILSAVYLWKDISDNGVAMHAHRYKQRCARTLNEPDWPRPNERLKAAESVKQQLPYDTRIQEMNKREVRTPATRKRRLDKEISQKAFADVSHIIPNVHFFPTFELSSSILLCNLGRILVERKLEEERGGNAAHEDEDETCEDISIHQRDESNGHFESMLTEYTAVVKSYFLTCRIYMKERFNGDIKLNFMSFPQYLAVSRSQSFLCNSGLMTNVGDVADELIDFGRELLSERQLKQHFTSVHVTTGIAMLVMSFKAQQGSYRSPTAAAGAETVSSSGFNRGDVARRTPFDTMCYAFRRLDVVDFSDVDKMTSEMYSASHIFETCCHNDPNDLNARLWYLASLLGTLLLSSGKLSQLFGFSDADARRIGRHNQLSTKLGMYESVRKEVSEAFLQLWRNIDSDPHNSNEYNEDGSTPPPLPCSSFSSSSVKPGYHHMIMSSLLEWKEAIFLLCRNGDSQDCRSITQLHAWHTICWAQQEKTNVALRRVRQLHETKVITTDTFLTILANHVEENASNAIGWVELMSYLGCVGEKQEEDVERNKTWWGDGRSWWQNVFFHLPPQLSKFRHANTDVIIVDADFALLSLETLQNNMYASMGSCFANQNTVHSTGICFSSGSVVGIEWLRLPDEEWDNLYTEEEEEEEDSDEYYFYGRGTFRDKLERLLPQQCHEVVSSLFEESDIVLQSMTSALDECMSNDRIGSFCKIMYIKIVIVCHLFGINHRFVQQSINWLYEQASYHNPEENRVHEHESNAALCVLTWLCVYHGVDIQTMLCDTRKKNRDNAKARERKLLQNRRHFTPLGAQKIMSEAF